jgi:thiol:disulfide interchange protein DsbC
MFARAAAFCVLVAATIGGPAHANDAEIAKLRAELQRAFPEVSSATIRPSPVGGIYEVEHNGDILYMSADGKFLILGDVIDLKTRSNLTRAKREQRVAAALNGVGDQNMIIIGPKDAKHTLTVFTDVDCPYCAKLHKEVPELNRNGVRVRYLLYPRGGIGSETYRKSVAVWCSDDRAKAIGIAKAGGKIEMKTCPNPVEQHFKLGMQINIEGTPAVFLDSGRQVGGYVPAAKLLAAMGIKDEKSTSAR